ncbi:nucleotidyltransferase domain-containing protein [Thermoproteota archaeon]
MHDRGFDRWVYTRELAQLAAVSTSTASIECRKLAKKDMLLSKSEGREKSYKIKLANDQARKLYELFETEKREKFYKKHRRLAWALQDLAKRVFELLPQIQTVLLFGSAARGALTKTSDVDLLVIVPTIEQDAFNTLMKSVDSLAADIRGMYGFPFSILTMTMKDFEAAILEKKRIVQDVLRDGIVLFGEGRYYQMLAKVLS